MKILRVVMTENRRSFLVSYPVILGAGGVVLVLHLWWLASADHQGEVISALGAVATVFGIWMASRPYVRLGIAGMIEAGLPKDDAGFLTGPNWFEEFRAIQDAARPGVTRDVWAERVIAVTVVVIGTLLNGYGTPIARVLGMRI